MSRIDQLLQQMIAETSQQVLPTVYSATMLAGLQELQGLTAGIEAQRYFARQPAAAASVAHLTVAEMNDLMAFHGAVCCDEGHTVDKEGMRRLAQIGAVESVGFGKHRLTEFGVYLLAAAPEYSAQEGKSHE